jgi:glyoxylase-like metal-dependent hydrolase (beta-lactamase superfamily II)
MESQSGNLIFRFQSWLGQVPPPYHPRRHLYRRPQETSAPELAYDHEGVFSLQLAGRSVRPEAVDYVLCTHLHVDHVGWNTQLRDGRWVPTFPNATYVISRQEWAYWETVHHATRLEHLADSVLPIVEAGLATFVANDYALNNEVWLEPTPGHTPDHVSVHLASNSAHAVITAI